MVTTRSESRKKLEMLKKKKKNLSKKSLPLLPLSIFQTYYTTCAAKLESENLDLEKDNMEAAELIGNLENQIAVQNAQLEEVNYQNVALRARYQSLERQYLRLDIADSVKAERIRVLEHTLRTTNAFIQRNGLFNVALQENYNAYIQQMINDSNLAYLDPNTTEEEELDNDSESDVSTVLGNDEE